MTSLINELFTFPPVLKNMVHPLKGETSTVREEKSLFAHGGGRTGGFSTNALSFFLTCLKIARLDACDFTLDDV